MLDAAKDARDWRQAQATIIFRVEAGEVTSSMASLPQNLLTKLVMVAIENLVQHHDWQHSLSEEVQVYEVGDTFQALSCHR